MVNSIDLWSKSLAVVTVDTAARGCISADRSNRVRQRIKRQHDKNSEHTHTATSRTEINIQNDEETRWTQHLLLFMVILSWYRWKFVEVNNFALDQNYIYSWIKKKYENKNNKWTNWKRVIEWTADKFSVHLADNGHCECLSFSSQLFQITLVSSCLNFTVDDCVHATPNNRNARCSVVSAVNEENRNARRKKEWNRNKEQNFKYVQNYSSWILKTIGLLTKQHYTHTHHTYATHARNVRNLISIYIYIYRSLAIVLSFLHSVAVYPTDAHTHIPCIDGCRLTASPRDDANVRWSDDSAWHWRRSCRGHSHNKGEMSGMLNFVLLFLSFW